MTTTKELTDRFAAFLDEHHVCSLATTDSQRPHSANLFYARDGFALLWVSDPSSQHSVELKANPYVAATIAADCAEYSQIRGLQISGRARRITDMVECARARVLLETRYSFLKPAAEGSFTVRAVYEQAQIYRLDPARMVLIDNSQGFGHKDILDFGG
jgi:uncharacterized protein YhbP (UPF0306 family)